MRSAGCAGALGRGAARPQAEMAATLAPGPGAGSAGRSFPGAPAAAGPVGAAARGEDQAAGRAPGGRSRRRARLCPGRRETRGCRRGAQGAACARRPRSGLASACGWGRAPGPCGSARSSLGPSRPRQVAATAQPRDGRVPALLCRCPSRGCSKDSSFHAPDRRFLKIHSVVSHTEGKQKFPGFLFCFVFPCSQVLPSRP